MLCQKGNPYARLAPDSVVFYDFEGSGKEVFSVVEKNGGLSPTVRRSAKLDQATADHFTRLLGDRASYGAGTASCFDPHLGVVYYKNKKVAAYINICLDCNRLHASKTIDAQLQGKQGKGKEAYYIADGMSPGFRKEINGLLVKYHFSHQLDGESMFDQ